MTLKTRVQLMKIQICITELNYISKYINYVLYMYMTSDTEKSENSSHDRYRTFEHNQTNAHLRIFFRLFCKMYKCSLYFCKRKNGENVDINCV